MILYSSALDLVARDENCFNYVWSPQCPHDYMFLSSGELGLFILFTDKIVDFDRHLAKCIHNRIKKIGFSLIYDDITICTYDATRQFLVERSIFCWSDYVICTYEFGYSFKYVWLLFDRETYKFLGSMSRYAYCVNTEVFAKIIMALKEIDFT